MVTSARYALPSLTLHALTAGDPSSPPVVLLHGFPESSEAFRALLPRFAAAGFFAVAPDLRGYGQSDRPTSGYDLDTVAGDVAGLIAALGGKAHLVAQDWGGLVAYHAAAYHPERIDRLVVVNAPHPVVMAQRILSPRQVWRSWYAAFFQLPALPEALLSVGGGAIVPLLVKALVRRPPKGDTGALQRFASDLARPGAAACALAYYRSAFPRIARRRGGFADAPYPKIRAPFRLVWSDADGALSTLLTENLEPFFEKPPEVHHLAGAGHFLWLEDPDTYGRLCLEHLA